MWLGASHALKRLKRGKIAKKLASSGILVKAIPYEIINSGTVVFGKQSKSLVIKYTFPDGVTRTLISHDIFNNILNDRDGLCDFLYVPFNYDNYFIDLEINLTGQGSPNIVYYSNNSELIHDNVFQQKKNSNYDMRLFGYLALVVGFLILIFSALPSLFLFANTEAYKVEWNENYDANYNLVFSPIYYFKVRNKTYTCTSEFWGEKERYIERGKGIVYYDFSNPNDCITDFDRSFDDELWITYLLFLLPFLLSLPTSIIVIVLGFIILKKNKKNKSPL